MDISPQWTPEERLMVIVHLTARIKTMANLAHPDAMPTIFDYADTVQQVARQSAMFLEANRLRIQIIIGID